MSTMPVVREHHDDFAGVFGGGRGRGRPHNNAAARTPEPPAARTLLPGEALVQLRAGGDGVVFGTTALGSWVRLSFDVVAGFRRFEVAKLALQVGDNPKFRAALELIMDIDLSDGGPVSLETDEFEQRLAASLFRAELTDSRSGETKVIRLIEKAGAALS